MENVIRRHVAIVVLAAALLLQVLGLAFQIKVKRDNGDTTNLLRYWTVMAVTPVERAVIHTGDWVRGLWKDYFWLRGVREQNQRLNDEIGRLRLEQIYMAEDATRAHRLQALLNFKQHFIAETVVAQVIGGSGSELSRLVYIDKGDKDGLKTDMPVITPTGVVGKVIRVFPNSAQVLQINDQSSGIGALLEKSRLQGILKGAPDGTTLLNYIMPDEKIEVGERVLTSGGDRIFPKGLPIGTVAEVGKGSDIFLRIRVKPFTALNRVEEVLIITKTGELELPTIEEAPRRAADILAERLPTVQPKPPQPEGSAPGTAPGTAAPGTTAPPPTGTAPRPIPPTTGGAAAATPRASVPTQPRNVPPTTTAPKPVAPQRTGTTQSQTAPQ